MGDSCYMSINLINTRITHTVECENDYLLRAINNKCVNGFNIA